MTVAPLLFAMLSIGLSPQDSASPAASAPEDSHTRMLAELAELVERSRSENLYIGTAKVAEAREVLRLLTPDTTPLERWTTLGLLAQAEISAGETEKAIETLKKAFALVGRLPPASRAKLAQKNVLQLGIAHLRLAEDRNCVHCSNCASCIFPLRDGGVHADPEPARQAVQYFKQVLRRSDPSGDDHQTAKWLLNIAAMAVGEYPDGVPKRFLLKPKRFESPGEFPRFENIAPRLGVDSFNLCGGVIADDFDGDGDLDLLTSSWDYLRETLRFFVNDGGRFVDRSSEWGLDGICGGLNMVHADTDGDGDLDVLVLRGAWLGETGRHPNSLLRNDGDRFVDVTHDVGLGQAHYPTQTAAFADYDLDGDLDLYIGNESFPASPAPSQLFENDGHGQFTDVAAAAGVLNDRFAKAVCWGDYDADGDPDLFVSNYVGDNRLYRNDGERHFTDVAEELGVQAPKMSFPAWFWDYDNDGHLDLWVSCYVESVAAVARSYQGMAGTSEGVRLYRGDGLGGFEEVAKKAGLGLTVPPMGSNFGDVNMDGWPDFYLGTGYPDYAALMPNILYVNRGGRFADLSTAAGLGHLQKGHAIAFADFDHDGDNDLYAQMGGAFRGDGFANALFENPGFGHHWIQLRLVGTRSNTFGVGCRVKLVIEEEGGPRTIYHWINAGGTFGGNPLTPTLGLGRATALTRLEVHWPASLTTQVFEAVPMDHSVVVTEGDEELKVSARKRLLFSGE